MKGTVKSVRTLFTWILILVLGGCAPRVSQKQEPFVSPAPAPNRVELLLYFGNQNADGLVTERRTVERKGESLESLAVNELIKGPQDGGVRSVPAETKLLSVKVENKIAYVDFSKEVQTKHWGGSAGEAMTIGSVVYTLTELPGIDKVQFLVEGKTNESIWGHRSTGEPIGRDNEKQPIAQPETAVPTPVGDVWVDQSPELAGDIRAMATGEFTGRQPELMVAAGDRLYLYRQSGQGYKLVTEQRLDRFVSDIASADLDGDGLSELLVVGASSSNWNASVPGFLSVYKWQGQELKRIIDISHGQSPLSSVGAMEIVGGGSLEILASNQNGLWIYTLDTPTHLRQLYALSRFAGNIATRRDASGKEYMAWAGSTGVDLALYTWESGGFKEQWAVHGGAEWMGGKPLLGDLNGDRKLDVAVQNMSGGLSFFDDKGKSVTLSEPTAQKLRELSSSHSLMVDINGDGRDELLVSQGKHLLVQKLK